MIQIRGLRLSYGGGRARETPVLEDIDLSVEAGESVVITGPSGCGKTTLLYVLCGLIPPSAGEVRIAGQPVLGPRRDVALILQDAGLLPWKTVWKNAALGLELSGEDPHRASRILEDLDIGELAGRYPAQLSGGQKHRVGIARALAVDPKLLLMDEPLASLDTFTKEHIQTLILELWRRRGHTQVLVTHDTEEAVYLGQRIVVLSPRPATVKAELDNPQMGSPDWRESAAFYERVRALRELLE